MHNTGIGRHLGQKSEYKSQYDPTLLVKEPRQSNRTYLGLENNNLPFVGYDTWNAYEVSGLMDSGMPVTGVAKIVYSCSNEYIVESKSLKLYFNSFNMTKLGSNQHDVRLEISKRATEDLSKLLETPVSVHIFSDSDIIDVEISAYEEYFSSFDTLEDICVIDNVSSYQEDPNLLEIVDNQEYCYKRLHSSLLKSNCKISKQPDWGNVFISYKGKKIVSNESLLKYIISFRDENHFHEEIVEAIYKRLWDLNIFQELHVMCLYARRGGIDICPQRANKSILLHHSLMGVKSAHIKTPKQ